MRESAEHLGPHNTKVLHTLETLAEIREGSVEDVAEEMTEEACQDSFTPLVEVV